MRNLNTDELAFVAGGTGQCTPESSASGNNIGGITNSGSLGGDLIAIYEGLVEATSHVIERVANAF